MSRATMVDLPPEEDQETTDTLDNEANEIQQLDLNLDVEQPPQEEPTLPEKYQGKSLEQVVQMHQEAEKLLGRQSSEVGELRKVVDNKVYEKAIDDASDLIRDGYNISTALRRTEVFPSILLQLASTGEDTGELDDLLDRAADYYQKQVDALVERMTTLIEPLLILLVGAVIALMVVLTYLPVFHLGSALQSGL